MKIFKKCNILSVKIVFVICTIFFCVSCSKNEQDTSKDQNSAKTQAQIALASRYLDEGLNDKAIDVLELVFEKNQNSAEILQMLGTAYLKDNDNSLAAFHFERAAEIDASKSIYFLYAGRANYADHEMKKAIDDYEQYLDIFDDDYIAWLELSNIYIETKNIQKAYNIYKKIANNISVVTEINNDVLCKVANIFWRVNDLNNAKLLLTELQSRKYDVTLVNIGLLKIAIAEKNWDNAKKLFAFFEDKEDILRKEDLLTVKNKFSQWEQEQTRILNNIDEVCSFRKISSWERESQQQASLDLNPNLTVAEGHLEKNKIKPPAFLSNSLGISAVSNFTSGMNIFESNVESELSQNSDQEISTTDFKKVSVEEHLTDTSSIENLSREKSLEEDNINLNNSSNELKSKNAVWQDLAKNEHLADHWYNGALFMYHVDDFKSSEMMILEAINRDPDNIQYTLVYLKIAERTHTSNEYLKILQNAKDKFFDNPEITYMLARCYEVILKDRKHAIEKYREFLLICDENHQYRDAAVKALERLSFR